MHTHRKLVNSLPAHHFIPSLTQILQIPRQRSRITAHIHHARWRHLHDGIQETLVAAFPRRVYHDDVSVYAVSLIHLRQYFFCLSYIEAGICNTVDSGVVSGVFDSLWNDFYSVYLPCFLCEEEGNRADSAVQIPDRLISGEGGIFQSLFI